MNGNNNPKVHVWQKNNHKTDKGIVDFKQNKSTNCKITCDSTVLDNSLLELGPNK